jgi:regulator of protease activity HflC (stomatin/prohibitin superfamily)
LHKTLHEETKSWGIEIVRTELKEIDPPADVQETMNKVVKAENEKIAAIDYATATETKADDAEAIRLVNEAANKYFIGNAQLLRKLQALESALENNAKIVIPTGSELVNIIGEMAGVVPLNK